MKQRYFTTRVIFEFVLNLDLLGPISLRTKIIVSEVNLDVYVCRKRGSKFINYLGKLVVISFDKCEKSLFVLV